MVLGALVAPVTASASPLAVKAPLSTPPSGGGGISGGSSNPDPVSPSGGGSFYPPAIHAPKQAPPPNRHTHGKWVRGFTVTEYWPAPEAWFVGRMVKAPGLPGRHRIDWLYSAMGLSMEGDGVGLDGRTYHIDAMGEGGWVTSSGKPTSASNEFAAGPPFWRAGGYWDNRRGGVTFPLSAGGWYAGPGRSYVPLRGVTFAEGPSLPIHFWQSIAVDPRIIPMGSKVYIPAYRDDGHGGWFLAQDTGGAINGHRIDVYRRPPKSSGVGGRYLSSQRVYVVKP